MIEPIKLQNRILTAIQRSNVESAVTSIQQINDVNFHFSSKEGLHNYTPLHLAAEKGLAEVVNALLNKGANALAITTPTKLTPLYVALEKKKELASKGENTANFDKIIATLIENQPVLCVMRGYIYNSPFHLAASSPFMTEQLKLILSCQNIVKMNIRFGNANGDTALHLAAQCNNFEAVKLLVENCASITRRNHDHKTAAELTSNKDIKEYLEANKNLPREKVAGALYDCRTYEDPAEEVTLQARANKTLLNAYQQNQPQNSNNELHNDASKSSRFCVIS